MTQSPPTPTDIKLHQQSRVLEISFDDGSVFNLTCEYLRVFSPSAEVRGHGPGQAVLQLGKEDVNISTIEPVGRYAVRLGFDDGHDTGLYSWEVLYDLGLNYEAYWADYLQRLRDAGHVRKPI
ncbi:MAG: 1-(5-phosphoribosyl)-5-((5-phosphoribosylamino)methylideneamino)imidazole-4-carboxamide isomerase [Thiotrichales bacterium]|nr:1-(5-phosphoribosyl)-5-((5-phosphoribosylamino)methylideneamino)imidazole-4-carboxamide isomerase [Thiotrichales bacterium]